MGSATSDYLTARHHKRKREEEAEQAQASEVTRCWQAAALVVTARPPRDFSTAVLSPRAVHTKRAETGESGAVVLRARGGVNTFTEVLVTLQEGALQAPAIRFTLTVRWVPGRCLHADQQPLVLRVAAWVEAAAELEHTQA